MNPFRGSYWFVWQIHLLRLFYSSGQGGDMKTEQWTWAQYLEECKAVAAPDKLFQEVCVCMCACYSSRNCTSLIKTNLIHSVIWALILLCHVCPVTASANGKERLQTRDEAGGHRPATSVHVFRPHCGWSESDFHYHGQWLLMAGIFRTRNHSLICVCTHHRPVVACLPQGWFYLSNVKVSNSLTEDRILKKNNPKA